MLNINIICVGKLKEKYLKDALNEYIKRLSRYCKLTITELPDEKIPDKLNPNLEIDIKTKESNNIINHIKKDSYIIALDLTGKQFTSEEFSKKIENLRNSHDNTTKPLAPLFKNEDDYKDFKKRHDKDTVVKKDLKTYGAFRNPAAYRI